MTHSLGHLEEILGLSHEQFASKLARKQDPLLYISARLEKQQKQKEAPQIAEPDSDDDDEEITEQPKKETETRPSILPQIYGTLSTPVTSESPEAERSKLYTKTLIHLNIKVFISHHNPTTLQSFVMRTFEEQPIKWLALAASQRFILQARGFSRTQTILPSEVFRAGGDGDELVVVEPSALVGDVFEDGELAFVALNCTIDDRSTASMKVTRRGTPQYSPFLCRAFKKEDGVRHARVTQHFGTPKRRTLMNEGGSDPLRFLPAKQPDPSASSFFMTQGAAEQGQGHEKKHMWLAAMKSSRHLIQQPTGNAQVEKLDAFDACFKGIRHNYLKMDGKKCKVVLDKIRAQLQFLFEPTLKSFCYYTVSTIRDNSAEATRISYYELEELTNRARLLDTTTTHGLQLFRRLFAETTRDYQDTFDASGNPTKEMSISETFEFFLRLAVEAFNPEELKPLTVMDVNEMEVRRTSIQSNDEPEVAAVKWAIAQIEPTLQLQIQGIDDIKVKTRSPHIISLLQNSMPRLLEVYVGYLPVSAAEREAYLSKQGRPTITAAAALKLLQDAALVVTAGQPQLKPEPGKTSPNGKPEKQKAKLNAAAQRVVWQAIAQSQSTHKSKVASDTRIIFAEFIETCARVALVKWKNSKLSFHAKFEMAIDSVTKLWGELPKSPSHKRRRRTQRPRSTHDRRIILHDPMAYDASHSHGDVRGAVGHVMPTRPTRGGGRRRSSVVLGGRALLDILNDKTAMGVIAAAGSKKRNKKLRPRQEEQGGAVAVSDDSKGAEDLYSAATDINCYYQKPLSLRKMNG